MFRTQSEYVGWAHRKMHEREVAQRDAEASNLRDALVRSVEQGLRTAWAASPDLFPTTFDPHAAAEYVTEFILR